MNILISKKVVNTYKKLPRNILISFFLNKTNYDSVKLPKNSFNLSDDF